MESLNLGLAEGGGDWMVRTREGFNVELMSLNVYIYISRSNPFPSLLWCCMGPSTPLHMLVNISASLYRCCHTDTDNAPVAVMPGHKEHAWQMGPAWLVPLHRSNPRHSRSKALDSTDATGTPTVLPV